MHITRIIAGTLIIAMAGLISGLTGAHAQDASGATPPAEYPPSSYTGKQYVDSRGCIYIRAEIDGSVTWVPRVKRDRSQICGYKPTVVAGTTKSPEGAASAPVESSEPEVPQATTAATAAEPVTQPDNAASAEQEAVATAKPESAAQTASETASQTTRPKQRPETTTPATAAAVKAVEPKTTTSKPRSRPAATPARTVTVVPVANGKAQPEVQLSERTRVVPRHVYENRQHVQSARIPRGYRSVWDDDRLNPRRAERTLAPANVLGTVTVPSGYQIVQRGDDRFNPRRGSRTAEGDAQTMLVWTNEVPMRLVRVPANRQVIRVDETAAKSAAETEFEGTFRVSTQSAPKSKVMYDR